MSNAAIDISSKARVRSPGFPFIGLKKALARAKEFYDHEKRNWANVKVAVKHWGFNEASSGGKQTLAALSAYGILQDSGSGEARQVRLGDEALKVILDTRNPSPERQVLVKQLALKPKLHKEIWDKYEGQLPSRENLRHFLVVEHDPPFNENWVDHFIGEFLATLDFAGLAKSDILSTEDEDTDGQEVGRAEEPPKVGDYVQWESQGVLQFPSPRRIQGLSEDGSWAFVEGSSTGLPVKELSVVDPPDLAPSTDKAQVPPSSPFLSVKDRLSVNRQDVFSLTEGPVTIQWPATLSPESFEDLSAWLDILKRKIGRSVGP